MKENINFKRILIFSFLLTIFLSLSLRSGEARKVQIRVKVKKANVRLEPATESMVISQAPLGAILEVEYKKGEWYLVNLPPDQDGFVVSGYIHQDNVTVIGEIGDIRAEKAASGERALSVKIRIKTNEAEVRAAPDFTAEIIGRTPQGTVLESVGMQEEWYKVLITSNLSGYIHRGHVEILEKEVPAEKVMEEEKTEEEQPEKISPQIQKPEIPSKKYPRAPGKSYFSIGLGYGIPYGTLGMNCEFNTIFPTEEKVFDYFSITAGFGYFSGGIKYVFGLRGYPLGRKGNWWPRISIYYGTVGIYKTYYGKHKNASGPAFGAGVVWMSAKKISIDIELQYRIPSIPAGYVKKEGVDITLSAGVQYNF